MNEREELQETECSGDASAHAPENVITIVNGDDEKRSIKERIQERKFKNQQMRRTLTESIEDKARESEPDEQPHVRLKLQQFTNGGGVPYRDVEGNDRVDGEDGGPTEYEKWRRELNDKKRKARLEAEAREFKSPHRSPDISNIDRRRQLDGQIDDFLYDYLQDEGVF